jgi:DNA-binding NtrC family response regulator
VGDPETKQRHDSATFINAPTKPEVYLLVVYPPAQQAIHGIATPTLTLGRSISPPQADLLFEDAAMSRLHATLTRGPTSWQVTDQKSVNGSFLNGRTLRGGDPVPLADGAIVRFADTLAVFRTTPPSPGGDFGAGEQAIFPGGSPVALAVRQQLRKLALASGHGLIVGETGTGKERAARSLEAPGQPFLAINCAELTRDFARSELFGHVRGAFTGANAKKIGLVEAAREGVLFLDEIGELPLDVQGDLLRFLEDGSYRPMGSNQVEKSKVRVVAATNIDLEEAVREGRFRRDLLARLRAHNATVELPPLHERREDILGWAAFFAREARGQASPLWSVGAAECLLLYPWRDNLRELRGAVRALLAGGRPEPLQRTDLPEAIQNHCSDLRTLTPGTPSKAAKRLQEPRPDEIEAALFENKGVMKATAEKLDVDRRHLYRLCKRYDINVESYRNP